MNHVYRWATTRYGPLADRLQGRLNEQCRVITRGRNVGGMAVSRYPVGAEHTLSLEYSSAFPYPSQSPSGSSADVCSATTRHERRAFL